MFHAKVAIYYCKPLESWSCLRSEREHVCKIYTTRATRLNREDDNKARTPKAPESSESPPNMLPPPERIIEQRRMLKMRAINVQPQKWLENLAAVAPPHTPLGLGHVQQHPFRRPAWICGYTAIFQHITVLRVCIGVWYAMNGENMCGRARASTSANDLNASSCAFLLQTTTYILRGSKYAWRSRFQNHNVATAAVRQLRPNLTKTHILSSTLVTKRTIKIVKDWIIPACVQYAGGIHTAARVSRRQW